MTLFSFIAGAISDVGIQKKEGKNCQNVIATSEIVLSLRPMITILRQGALYHWVLRISPQRQLVHHMAKCLHSIKD